MNRRLVILQGFNRREHTGWTMEVIDVSATTLTDCLALLIACLFVLGCFAVTLLSIAVTVYVIVWAAAMALKAVGVIHLGAMLI